MMSCHSDIPDKVLKKSSTDGSLYVLKYSIIFVNDPRQEYYQKHN